MAEHAVRFMLSDHGDEDVQDCDAERVVVGGRKKRRGRGITDAIIENDELVKLVQELELENTRLQDELDVALSLAALPETPSSMKRSGSFARADTRKGTGISVDVAEVGSCVDRIPRLEAAEEELLLLKRKHEATCTDLDHLRRELQVAREQQRKDEADIATLTSRNEVLACAVAESDMVRRRLEAEKAESLAIAAVLRDDCMARQAGESVDLDFEDLSRPRWRSAGRGAASACLASELRAADPRRFDSEEVDDCASVAVAPSVDVRGRSVVRWDSVQASGSCWRSEGRGPLEEFLRISPDMGAQDRRLLATLGPPPPRVAGFLLKRSPNRLRALWPWQERFFILESGRLSWWSSDDHLGHPCRGCLDFVVNKGEVVLDVDDRAAFHLVPIDGGVWYAGSFTNATHGRALTLLVADSWMTRQAWVAAIHDHIEWCSRPPMRANSVGSSSGPRVS